jgi:hypothetical protein
MIMEPLSARGERRLTEIATPADSILLIEALLATRPDGAPKVVSNSPHVRIWLRYEKPPLRLRSATALRSTRDPYQKGHR